MNMEGVRGPHAQAQHRVTGASSWLRNEEKSRVCHDFHEHQEEFEVPISSATALHGAQSPVATMEGRTKGWPGGRR